MNINYKGKKNITPLYAQMASLNLAGFKRLLEHGADPNIPIEDGNSVIWLAAKASAHTDISIKMLKLCLDHGGDPNWVFHKKYKEPNHTAFEDGSSLISGAVSFSDRPIEVIKLLLEHGADINAKDENGMTPLEFCSGHHYDVAYFLLQEGADYTEKNKDGKNYFVWGLEQFPVSCTTDGKISASEQKQWRKKVIAFLKEKGIEVHLKYPD